MTYRRLRTGREVGQKPTIYRNLYENTGPGIYATLSSPGLPECFNLAKPLTAMHGVNIALRRFLNNHGNIATEESPKPGLCPNLILNDFKGSL